MKILKKTLLIIIATLVVAYLLAIISGNSHLFKGISSTYLIGNSGPTIDEHAFFESRSVEVGNQQPWVFDNNYNETENKELLSEIESFDPAAFLIVKSDKIIYEKYWGIYNENSQTNSFSMAKTFIGLLIGIAIDEGKINSVDDPVSDYLPQYKETPELTIKHLLTMSSGINFDESYNSPFGHMAKAYYGTDIKELNAGEIGFITTGIKVLSETKVGDTICEANKPLLEALPGFKPSKPVVFCGLFPVDSSEYQKLKDGLGKLQLNDASFSYEAESSSALGLGVNFLNSSEQETNYA